jgi:hypothetical protein
MTLESGVALDEKTISFEMKKGYKPPFSELSTTISPRSATTIATSDNVVTIDFPQGAVLDDTKITLKPQRTEQVPKATAGITLGATVFSIEGLSGLLSKEATITVKYSSDDTAVVNGDSGKLLLGRYDNIEMKWVPMATKVDQVAGTLTVNTTRFSIWAVMVSEGALPTEGVTKTPGFTIGIACGALALLIVLKRQRGR